MGIYSLRWKGSRDLFRRRLLDAGSIISGVGLLSYSLWYSTFYATIQDSAERRITLFYSGRFSGAERLILGKLWDVFFDFLGYALETLDETRGTCGLLGMSLSFLDSKQIYLGNSGGLFEAWNYKVSRCKRLMGLGTLDYSLGNSLFWFLGFGTKRSSLRYEILGL